MRKSLFSLIKTKKFRYGAAASAFTAAFIAIVVVFNVIFTSLAGKYMWYIDMTSDEVFTLSEKAVEMISDVTAEVNIYFAAEPDVLMTGTYSVYTRYVYQTALQLQNKFDNIKVKCVDVLKNPSFFREFYNTSASEIAQTSVIIESMGESRVFNITAFFSADDPSDISTIWAYNGEKRFVSGIMQVTQTDTPKVLFTTQHGEDLSSALSLASVFDENRFTVDKVDLTKETLDEDCRILVIYNPIYDFVGDEAEDEGKNEIEALDRFLDNYGCLIVFASPEYAENLRNLNEFLEEWGISYVAGTTVRDYEHSMSTDGYSVTTEYQRDTLGGSVYSDLNALSTPPKTIIRKSMPIDIIWANGIGTTGEREVSSVLKSYNTSEIIKDGVVEGSGSYNLMVMARETRIVNSEYYYSYVFAAGSPSFASQSYLESQSYANEDIIAAAMKAAGRERVLAVLDRKPLDDSKIEVTTAEADDLTAAMTAVMPILFALCGFVVVTRRKHL